jgi:hypothetical protein
MNNDTAHNYYMYTDEGNAACDEAMLPIVSVARSLMPMLEAAYAKVSKTHREVYDTEPRNEMHQLVIDALRESGLIY